MKESKRKFRSEIVFRKEAKMEYCGARGEINSYHWTRWRDICICPVCSSGSFCRYRGTDYVKQKKQCNQTIKLPRELYCLVPLFLLWWRYLQKDPLVLLLLKEISSTSSNTTINTTRSKTGIKHAMTTVFIINIIFWLFELSLAEWNFVSPTYLTQVVIYNYNKVG